MIGNDKEDTCARTRGWNRGFKNLQKLENRHLFSEEEEEGEEEKVRKKKMTFDFDTDKSDDRSSDEERLMTTGKDPSAMERELKSLRVSSKVLIPIDDRLGDEQMGNYNEDKDDDAGGEDEDDEDTGTETETGRGRTREEGRSAPLLQLCVHFRRGVREALVCLFVLRAVAGGQNSNSS